MDLNKYNTLRNKIKNRDFENKYSKLDKFLYWFSWAGNAGSIFFAYFLVFPAFFKAINANLSTGDLSIYLAGFLSVVVLGVFELVKREVLSNLSFDFVRHKYRITKTFVGWFLFSITLICASFYFSLNGAINFADTSKKENITIEQNIDSEIDSLKLLYTNQKQPFIDDNKSLRDANVGLRNKINETPLNFRTVRKELQENIDKNLQTIRMNDDKIDELNDELIKITDELKNGLQKTKNENETEDSKNIILFLIISSSIELIIILGVYFREYYDYNVYLTNSSELEGIIIKRDRYNTLLKFLYKEGIVSRGEKIMGVSKLKEIVSEKSKITTPHKFVDDFINDITYMGIIELVGKRRVIKVDYEEALEKVKKLDDTMRLLENLK